MRLSPLLALTCTVAACATGAVDDGAPQLAPDAALATSTASLTTGGAAPDLWRPPHPWPRMAWGNAWDTPVAGSSSYDLSAFFDGADPHWIMLIRQGEVLHRYFHAGRWQDDYLGVTTAGPSQFLGAVGARDTTTGTFYVAASKPQWHTFVRVGTNGNWNASWIDLGGSTLYKPAIAATSGWAHVFVTGTDGALYHRIGTGTTNWPNTWEQLAPLPTHRPLIAAPAATVRVGTSVIDLVAVADDRSLWHMTYRAYTKGTWEQIPTGELAHGDVAIASTSGADLEVLALGEDNLVHQHSWNGQQWSDAGIAVPCSPQNIGTAGGHAFNKTPIALASKGDGTADVYMADSVNDTTMHDQYAWGNNLTAAGAQICGTCNLPGQSCCQDAGWGPSCHNDLACNGGTARCEARPCGTDGASVCTANGSQRCQPGLTDDGTGTCVACGARYQRCCSGNEPTCQDGACTDEGNYGWWCMACGTIGAAACDSAPACTQARAVEDPSTHTCVHCGELGELACPATGPGPTLVCFAGVVDWGTSRCETPPPPSPSPTPIPPARPAVDAPNCGLAQLGLAAPCCAEKQACESGWVCRPSSDQKDYCYPPQSKQTGPACKNGSPVIVSVCVDDEWGANTYTNAWCSEDEATSFFEKYCQNIKGEYGLAQCEVSVGSCH